MSTCNGGGEEGRGGGGRRGGHDTACCTKTAIRLFREDNSTRETFHQHFHPIILNDVIMWSFRNSDECFTRTPADFLTNSSLSNYMQSLWTLACPGGVFLLDKTVFTRRKQSQLPETCKFFRTKRTWKWQREQNAAATCKRGSRHRAMKTLTNDWHGLLLCSCWYARQNS